MLGTLLLGLTLLAAPKTPPKIEAPGKIEGPKLDFDLPDLPKADGLEKKTAGPKEPETKQLSGGLQSTLSPSAAVSAKVEQVTHARRFNTTARGRQAVGRIDEFKVPGFPATIPAFQTCLRLSSEDREAIAVKIEVRNPGGQPVMASQADVSFDAGSLTELVIEWENFQADRAGDYVLWVEINGRPGGSFPMPVRGR